MDTARLAAPEIDRLVLAVNRAVGEGDEALAAQAGLSGPGLIKHYADWLLTTGVPRQVAVARLPYARDGVVDAWIDELLTAGLLEERDGRIHAVGALTPLAQAVLDSRAKAAATLWAGHGDAVAIAMAGAKQVAAAAPDEFAVGVSHRALPDPDDQLLALHQRLVTLRYLRSHCHVQAWRQAELTPMEIVSMTALWNRDRTAGVPGSLVQRGYVDGAELTEEGELIRGEIEYVTNQHAQVLFTVLADPDGFLEALRSLPSTDEDD